MKELKFIVELEDDGFVATAVGESISTSADSRQELVHNVRDAVLSHFGDSPSTPTVVHLHYVGDETIAIGNVDQSTEEFPVRNMVLKYENPFDPACPPDEWEAGQ